MLFPDPATVRNCHQWQQDKGIGGYETPTFTMDPQKTSRVIPLLESAALGEPLGRFTKMDSACNDVVLRWVRR